MKDSIVITTARLTLRELNPGDSKFIIDLLNQPSFIKNIGDKGVRNTQDAHRYIEQGPVSSYRDHGFGLWLIKLKNQQADIGMCGLLKRDYLPLPDLGFGLLPQHWGRGYAFEAARATLEVASNKGLSQVLAMTNSDNAASIKLLRRLGFSEHLFEQIPADAPDSSFFIHNNTASLPQQIGTPRLI